MPIVNAKVYKTLIKELTNRVNSLYYAVEAIPLRVSENSIETRGSESEIRIVIEDFKTILSEFKRLK